MQRAETAQHDRLDGTQSFHAGAALSSDSSAPSDHEASHGSAGAVSDLRHERFQIGSRLGEGGMGVVYRARDTRNGTDVALKVMKGALEGTARRRFEREFQSLSALHHPYCLGVYDYGELGGGPFFTMELFLGQPITSLSARPLAERFEPLLQLTHALDYIHGHGIVHRDIKPSNILVRPATSPDGARHYETRLMDFGLAKYYGVRSSMTADAGFVGTVAYCAPEQINLDELDHRADLYCLGLVAYELLGGRYAFPEARLAGMRPLMQAQLNDKPRSLGELNTDVPGSIADAVMKYLRKQPRRRPESAGLLRAAIAGHLGIDERSMVTGVAIPTLRPTLSVTGFVCRSGEQEILDDVLRRCMRPRSGSGEVPPSVIVVSGEPGIGKSSVVQEAERIARGHGCQVYQGRCFDGNLSPFQPFVEILRQLIAGLRHQERQLVARDDDLTGTATAGQPVEALVRLMGIVGDYRGELLRIAPELRKYLPGEAYQQVDTGRDGDYIYRALSSFFVEIAAFQPVCLSFEDLQWADKSSLDLLRHLAAALANARRPSDGTACAPRLTILASARTGYPALEGLAAGLREQRHLLELPLAPLNEAETRELIALRLNCSPDELADDLVARVNALCGGNPFFIAETVRDWFEKQAITRSESGWVLRTEVGDTTDLPETVRDVMRLRLQGLAPQAQQAVQAAAVIGAVVDVDLLRDVLAELSEAEVLDAIDLLLPRRVFRETGSPGYIEFVHDLLHEIPYAELSATRRRMLHRRVGELLERRRAQGRSVAPAVLADHFREAGEPAKALSYTMEAAEAALDAYAFNNAIAQLTEAQKLLATTAEAPVRFKLWDMMGTACASAGRLDDAIAAFTEALKHASDGIERGRAELGLGTSFHKQGRFDDAVRHFDIALEHVEFPRSQSWMRFLFELNRNALYVHALPRGLRSRRGADQAERFDIALAANRELGQIFAVRHVFTYVSVSYCYAAIAKESDLQDHVAVAASKFALNWGVFGGHRIARHYCNRAERLIEGRPRDVIWARTMAHVGTSAYFAGRLDDAERVLRDSVEILDKIRDYYATFAHHFLRHLYGVRGDTALEFAEAEAEIALGTQLGDGEAMTWGLYGKANALARTGRLAEALELATTAHDRALERKSLTKIVAAQILGFTHLQSSNYAEAAAYLDLSARWVAEHQFPAEFTASTYPMKVESLLGPSWADPSGGPTPTMSRKAWRASFVARSFAWAFPNYEAHALRVSGRAAFARGKVSRAARFMERAIIAAETRGARYDLARAYLDASCVIPEKSDHYRVRGQRLLDELGAVVPEAERFGSRS